MKRQTLLAVLVALVLVGLAAVFSPVVQAQKVFTTEELAQFDGMEGRSAYFAYEGEVYDVTGSSFWEEGQHYGLQAGQDLTGQMEGAPHGEEVLAGFPVVGIYGSPPAEPSIEPAASPAVTTAEAPSLATERKWYEGRIRIYGISILGWTGILLGVAFVGNFATCFALPWTKLPLPWHGGRPGPDPLDKAQTRPHWGNVHKYFVWATVGFGILHGVLGLMQMLGFYL